MMTGRAGETSSVAVTARDRTEPAGACPLGFIAGFREFRLGVATMLQSMRATRLGRGLRVRTRRRCPPAAILDYDISMTHKTVKVAINYVDGSFQEYVASKAIITKYDRFSHERFEGKELVDKLLGDRWNTPPVKVTISFCSHGERQEFVVLYS